MHTRSGSYSSYQQRYGGSTSPTVKNPSTHVNKGPEMNDRDRLNDLLATEKYLTNGLNTFVHETSHQELYNDVLHILNETHHAARDIYNLMFEKGWYSLTQEQPQKIAKEHQKFSGYESQFPTQGQGYGQYSTGSVHYPTDY